MPAPPDARGIVTLAVRNRHYLEMAVDMALSARAFHRDPVALIADSALARAAAEEYAQVFDRVELLPARFEAGRAPKYGVLAVSPWSRSLFVDADCWVVGSLGDTLHEVEEGPPVRLLGEMLGPTSNRRHHGFAVRHLIRTFRLDGYLKNHSGVFAFRPAETKEIADELLSCYRDEVLQRLRLGKLGDELAFGIVGARRGFGQLVSHPMNWKLERLRPPFDAPVVHLIGVLPPPTFRTLCDAARARRRDAGLPDRGDAHWRWKLDRVRRTHRLGGLLLGLKRRLGLG